MVGCGFGWISAHARGVIVKLASLLAGAGRRNAAAGLLCLGALTLATLLGARTFEHALVSQSRARLQLQVGAYASALTAALAQRLALVYGVAAFVQSDGGGDPARFDRFAADIVASATGVLHVSLTRDGVITASYPAAMAPVGLDFAHDPRERVRREYERAMAAPHITIAGPFHEVGSGPHVSNHSLAVVALHRLRAGGLGPARAVLMAIDVPPLLRQVGIDPVPASLELALRDGGGGVFHGDAGLFARDAVVQRVELPDGAWELAATPRGGWPSGVAGQVALFRLAGLFIAVLASLVLYLLLQRLAARAQRAQELARRETEVWRKAMRIVGHEINNSLAPVTSLVYSAKQLVQRPELLPRLAPVLDVIAERSDHLRTFLDGYSRLARLPPPEKRPVEWRPFLAEIAALYPFVQVGTLPAAPGHFDPGQLQQVLINLLKNARESGSPEGEVQLEVRGGREVVITVLDRGPGMKEEELARAGEPFFTTKPAGSGLGLHLCREILQAHGGALELAARPGGGIVARARLPAG